MKNWDEDDGTEYCTAQSDYEDAQRIADVLDIELHTINFSSEYWDLVFEDFLTEYQSGRTPNPDVLCNRYIKFDVFIEYAKSLGANAIASGHYARSGTCNGEFALFRANDESKDQTYFLQAVTKENSSSVSFPCQHSSKPECEKSLERTNYTSTTRKTAREFASLANGGSTNSWKDLSQKNTVP